VHPVLQRLDVAVSPQDGIGALPAGYIDVPPGGVDGDGEDVEALRRAVHPERRFAGVVAARAVLAHHVRLAVRNADREGLSIGASAVLEGLAPAVFPERRPAAPSGHVHVAALGDEDAVGVPVRAVALQLLPLAVHPQPRAPELAHILESRHVHLAARDADGAGLAVPHSADDLPVLPKHGVV